MHSAVNRIELNMRMELIVESNANEFEYQIGFS